MSDRERYIVKLIAESRFLYGRLGFVYCLVDLNGNRITRFCKSKAGARRAARRRGLTVCAGEQYIFEGF